MFLSWMYLLLYIWVLYKPFPKRKEIYNVCKYRLQINCIKHQLNIYNNIVFDIITDIAMIDNLHPYI